MGASRNRKAKLKRTSVSQRRKPEIDMNALAPPSPSALEEELLRLRKTVTEIKEDMRDLRKDFQEKEFSERRSRKLTVSMYTMPLLAKIITDGLGVFIATLFFNMIAAWHSLPIWMQSNNVLAGIIFSWLLIEWMAYEAQRQR
jgi:hypothetical protein